MRKHSGDHKVLLVGLIIVQRYCHIWYIFKVTVLYKMATQFPQTSLNESSLADHSDCAQIKIDITNWRWEGVKYSRMWIFLDVRNSDLSNHFTPLAIGACASSSCNHLLTRQQGQMEVQRWRHESGTTAILNAEQGDTVLKHLQMTSTAILTGWMVSNWFILIQYSCVFF